jgi:tetratricopeptide (TPR) repeat protein
MARPRTICLLLAFITVLVYWPVRHADFIVFDDPDYVTYNSHVQAGLTWDGVKWAFTSSSASNWHPLTWLSHMLDASLFRSDSTAVHIVNILFHAANVVLLFLLLFRATNRMWPAAFVAALFAWHPLHVESVAWISERKDVLSTFFGLLSLLAYVAYADKAKNQESGSKTDYAFAILFFVLGLLAKPMLVTLPFVMLLLDFWPLERFQLFLKTINRSDTQNATRRTQCTSLLLEKAPFFALTIASSIITFLAQRGEAVMSFEQRPLGIRLANATVAYLEYLGKTVWPANLAVIYPLPHEIPSWQVIAAVSLLVGITMLAWSARQSAPYLLVGWLWFLGTLIPVIGIVQVGGQALADRYTYVPLIGIFLAIAWGAADLAVRFRVQTVLTAAIAAVVLIACTAATERQLTFWENSEKLFRHTLQITKGNAIAHVNLGVALEKQKLREDALGEYRKALELAPGLFQAHNNLANLLADLGDPENAVREYEEALRLNPSAATAHVNLGELLSDMGKFDAAMGEYTKAEQLAPDDYRPQYQMGKTLLRHGEGAEAVKRFRAALQMNPNDFEILTWLARALAADRNPAVRNGTEAVSLAERANDVSGGRQPFVLDALAMAYAEAGRFQDAQKAVQDAIDIAAASGSTNMVPKLQDRLRLYQSNVPYRDDFSGK